MTVTTAAPATSAREALQAGACSPSCLLGGSGIERTGRTEQICRCKCGGQFHGILLRYISAPEQPAATANRASGRRHRKGHGR